MGNTNQGATRARVLPLYEQIVGSLLSPIDGKEKEEKGENNNKKHRILYYSASTRRLQHGSIRTHDS
jgi:hypothetical protein